MIVGKRIYENAKEINIERDPKQSFTISVGIYSDIPTENDTLEKFIDKSDQTLYRIKESGRNRVALFKEFFEEEENDGT
jgi:diguanylate cyclase (GGDEF)-like protein